MCGITGVAFADTQQRPDTNLLARMCAALTHRGPDSAGGLVEPGIGLAMRRLSVIDVEGGTQPIFNEDKSVAVVFNGEIYNFPELREQLISQGHRFATNSDTETIVHLYEQHGLEFVAKLSGMFGIAIWDFREQRLMLVRDRLGVKPLYYFQDDSKLVFGSELKAILQDTSVPRHVDYESLHQLIAYGHILWPRTPFRSIQELPPATVLVYQAGKVTRREYWDLAFTQPERYESETEPKLLSDLQAHIRNAVQKRLISDVPLGAFLSGGIDSGIVVALMSQLMSAPVKTFSIGFDDNEFSELPYARMVAEHCGTEHHELIVKPDVPNIMDALIRHHDAPFYDSSAIPTYYVSKFAREHVTVALSGDGGDEMFAGYNIYVASKVARLCRFVPNALSRWLGNGLGAVLPESTKYINKARVAREFAYGIGLDPLRSYTRWATKIKRETRDELYLAPELVAAQQVPDEALWAELFAKQADATELSKLLYLGTKTELPADMLRKVDRMSMAHSLEVRSPLLDYELFEFAAGLHDDAKLSGRTTKSSLRKLAQQLLPAGVVNRPKRGFSIPLDRWLREPLRDYTEQILFDSLTEGRAIFNSRFVRRLANEHFTGRISRGRELWTLLTIELWHRHYIDHFDTVSEPPPLQLTS